MRIIVLILLVLGAQFSATAFSPTPAGKAWALWPFAADSKSWLGVVSGLRQPSGRIITPILAGVSTLGFLVAAVGLFGTFIPAGWWLPMVIVAVVASFLLHILYLGRWAILPILVDAVLLSGVLAQGWSAAVLRG